MTNLNKRDPEDQVAALITAMGLEAVDLYDSLPFASASDRKDLSKAFDLLEKTFRWGIQCDIRTLHVPL